MAGRIRTLRPNDLIRVLEKAGFTQRRQTGSHVIMAKAGMRSIPIPVHARSLKRALQMAIISQAGLTLDEVEKLLNE